MKKKKKLLWRCIIIPLVIISLFLFSCIGNKNNVKFNSNGKTQLKLYVFESGQFRINDMSVFYSNIKKGTAGENVSTCYLIVHPKGILMWDTGVSDSIAEYKDGITVYNGLMHIKVLKPLKKQLEEIAIKPEDVDYIAFSHFHSDHTGNTGYFTNAKLLTQEIEYNLAFGEYSEKFGYDPASYANLKTQIVKKLNGNYDVFNDGSVIIISTPGHTQGHQSLYINLSETGPVILSGDLYSSVEDHKNYIIPDITVDKKQLIKSYVLIDDIIDKTKAKLWIGHDKKQNEGIKHSPEFYN